MREIFLVRAASAPDGLHPYADWLIDQGRDADAVALIDPVQGDRGCPGSSPSAR